MRSQKQMILDIIQASTEHMTADQVYLAAKREKPSLAMGTVYRNLTLLAEEGIIRRVELPGGATHFDRTLRPHEHKICSCCGCVTDVELDGNLLTFLRERSGEDILGYHLMIVHTCPECRAKNEAKTNINIIN